jgi:leucyl-tRNA synthetase
MSKSRGNVVVPDHYIEKWGADAFRTYLMFLGPFEEGGDFRDASISGVKRFLDRLWASVIGVVDRGDTGASGDPDVMRKLHQTISKVGEDIPKLSYNTAVAAMMEYMNTLRRGERTPVREEVEPLVQLVAPFAPHIAEELWQKLGHGHTIFESTWPAFDPALAADEKIDLVIQVNGKTRGKVSVARDIAQDAAVAAAMADQSIAKFVSGEPRKIIFVPGRLLNIVA